MTETLHDSPLVIIGAGGHGRVVADLALRTGFSVAGFLDRSLEVRRDGIPVLGGDDLMETMVKRQNRLAMGLGSRSAWKRRITLCERIDRLESSVPTLIDPEAGVMPSVEIGRGTQVLMGARIQTGVTIEAWCVVNTAAVIEHDCWVHSNVHVAPGAILCGGVTVGEGAFIGAGSTVMEGVFVGAHATVGMGAVVIGDVPNGQVVAGIPARRKHVN